MLVKVYNQKKFKLLIVRLSVFPPGGSGKHARDQRVCRSRRGVQKRADAQFRPTKLLQIREAERQLHQLTFRGCRKNSESGEAIALVPRQTAQGPLLTGRSARNSGYTFLRQRFRPLH
jgi:hypothetical protein